MGRQEIIELIADNLGRPTKYSSQKWIALEREEGREKYQGRVYRGSNHQEEEFFLFSSDVVKSPFLPPFLSLSLFLSPLQTEICEAARALPVDKTGFSDA